jgi:hypothetical protein
MRFSDNSFTSATNNKLQGGASAVRSNYNQVDVKTLSFTNYFRCGKSSHGGML